MVILVIGGSYMPAHIKSKGILLVAGPVCGAADCAFAVADFKHRNDAVRACIIITEVIEIAEGRAGMVEFVDGIGIILDEVVVCYETRTALNGIDAVLTGYDTDGIIGVHMAVLTGPCHLIAADEDDLVLTLIEAVNGGRIVIPLGMAV